MGHRCSAMVIELKSGDVVYLIAREGDEQGLREQFNIYRTTVIKAGITYEQASHICEALSKLGGGHVIDCRAFLTIMESLAGPIKQTRRNT